MLCILLQHPCVVVSRGLPIVIFFLINVCLPSKFPKYLENIAVMSDEDEIIYVKRQKTIHYGSLETAMMENLKQMRESEANANQNSSLKESKELFDLEAEMYVPNEPGPPVHKNHFFLFLGRKIRKSC